MILAAVYDRATEAHGPIMTFRTRAEANRTFQREAENAQGNIAQNKADYELYQLAEYNEETGAITNTTRERLSRAEDVAGA